MSPSGRDKKQKTQDPISLAIPPLMPPSSASTVSEAPKEQDQHETPEAPSLAVPPLNPPSSASTVSEAPKEQDQHETPEAPSLAVPLLEPPTSASAPPSALPSWTLEEWENLDAKAKDKIRSIFSELAPPNKTSHSDIKNEDKRESQTKTKAAPITSPQPLANPSEVSLFEKKKKKRNPFKEMNIEIVFANILSRINDIEKELKRSFAEDYSEIQKILESSKINGIGQYTPQEAKMIHDFLNTWKAIGGDEAVSMRIIHIIQNTPSLQMPSKSESKKHGLG